MLSRDEELLAKHLREAVPGLLAGVLCGELHSLLRAERARWAEEMKAQQRDHRETVRAARAEGRAEGFAAARGKAAGLADTEAEDWRRACIHDGDNPDASHEAITLSCIAKDIRAMTDEGGES